MIDHTHEPLILHCCKMYSIDPSQYNWEGPGEIHTSALCDNLFGSLGEASTWFRALRKRDTSYGNKILMDIRHNATPAVITEIGDKVTCLSGEIVIAACAFAKLDTVPTIIGRASPTAHSNPKTVRHWATNIEMTIPEIYEQMDSGEKKLPRIKWRVPTDEELDLELQSEYAIEKLALGDKSNATVTPQIRRDGVERLREAGTAQEIPYKKVKLFIPFTSFEHLFTTVTGYGGPKDPDSMVEKIFKGGDLPMPVAVRDGDYMKILGGNTRAGLAVLARQPLKCWVLDAVALRDMEVEEFRQTLEELVAGDPVAEGAAAEILDFYETGRLPTGHYPKDAPIYGIVRIASRIFGKLGYPDVIRRTFALTKHFKQQWELWSLEPDERELVEEEQRFGPLKHH